MQQTEQLIWIVDENRQFVYSNQRFVHFFQLQEQNIIGRHIAQVLPVAVAASFELHIGEVLHRSQDARFIQALIHPDETESFFEIKMFPIPEGVGAEAKPFDTDAVITTYYRLQLLDEISNDAIWDWNRQRHSFHFNKSMRTLARRDAEEGQDLKWFFEMVHPEDIVALENRIDWCLLHTCGQWEQQLRIRTGYSHETFICRFVARYAGGQLVQLVCVLKNIQEKSKLRNNLAKKEQELSQVLASNKVKDSETTKKNIGRELHDNVNQILTSTKLYLEFLDPTRPDFEELKRKSLDQLELAINSIRSISYNLVLPWFKEKGLLSCINGLIDDLMTANLNVAFTFNSPDIELLEEELKVSLYRIIQEQVKNILTHSKASNVHINLHLQTDKSLALLISDDGVGFNPGDRKKKGLGLKSIHQRVSAFGGELNIDSAEGNGCTLRVTLPLLQQAA